MKDNDYVEVIGPAYRNENGDKINMSRRRRVLRRHWEGTQGADLRAGGFELAPSMPTAPRRARNTQPNNDADQA